MTIRGIFILLINKILSEKLLSSPVLNESVTNKPMSKSAHRLIAIISLPMKKINLCCFASIWYLFSVSAIQPICAQTVGANSVRMRVPQIPVTSIKNLDTIPVARQAVSISYADGLGRPILEINLQSSPLLKDMIQAHAYDSVGREATEYLPFSDETKSAATSGTFRQAAVTNTLAFYNPASLGAPKLPVDGTPFLQAAFESSPLGRRIEQGAAGPDYQPGTGHTLTSSYEVYSPSQIPVPLWVITGKSISSTSSYLDSMLTQDVIKDANGHHQYFWKDKLGRVIDNRATDAPSSFNLIYNIYNQLGALAYKITSGGVRELSKRGSNTFTESMADPIFSVKVYAYHYDSIGRMVENKVPGKGWVYIIYNQNNQVMLRQDSNQRKKSQWLFAKYDALGRNVETGIYTNTQVTSRKALQALCDTSFPTLWETYVPGTGYTDNAFPQQSNGTALMPLLIYTNLYYDDYTFPGASTKAFLPNSLNSASTLRTRGLLTGESVTVMGSPSQVLLTVSYYDSEDRLIQKQSDNHLGQVDEVNNQYTFIGKLSVCQHITNITSAIRVPLQVRYVYDPMGRLVDTWVRSGYAGDVLVSHNEYNEAAQLVTRCLRSTNYYGRVSNVPQSITENSAITASTSDIAGVSIYLNPGFSFTASATTTYSANIGAGTFAQAIEYRYNIRGSLRTINNPTLTADGGVTQSDSTALFGEQVNYSEVTGLKGTPQYNVNVSSVAWRNKIEATGQPGVVKGSQGYIMRYDALNRQLTAGYSTSIA